MPARRSMPSASGQFFHIIGPHSVRNITPQPRAANSHATGCFLPGASRYSPGPRIPVRSAVFCPRRIATAESREFLCDWLHSVRSAALQPRAANSRAAGRVPFQIQSKARSRFNHPRAGFCILLSIRRCNLFGLVLRCRNSSNFHMCSYIAALICGSFFKTGFKLFKIVEFGHCYPSYD